ncbi:restriction endonuclease subunit S [Bacillus mycoides]|uniref:restriction endonuclease subunit S n=1 Tax=Bacillus mycoides TaxID=1405 RepID=UPI001F27C636|nr:restriction endonuclease subunit S [Bacillus mycoides]
MKNKRTPDIRFAGFNGDWEEHRLSELMEFSNGINAPKENYGKGRKMISVMDILADEPIIYGNIRNSVEVDDKTESKNKVENGDLVFVRSSEIPDEVGWAKAYLQEEYALYSGFSIRGKKKIDFDAKFIELSLNNSNREQIERKAGGSTRFNVSQSILNSILILEPSIEEQIEIGNFFEKLDDTIALHQQELTTLKQTKQGFLQKIFLQEIRFKDDGGEDFPNWEETDLSKLLSIPEKEIENNVSKNKLLTVKLHRNGVQVNQNTDTLKIGSTNYYRRKSGQFIYGKQNFFNGAFDIIPDKYDGYLSSGDVPTLDINENKVLPLYLLYYLGREGFYKRTESVASGTGSKRIHESTLLGINISLPTMKEQTKIGNFFKQLDDTIALHQRELDALKETKKAFLQKMFV